MIVDFLLMATKQCGVNIVNSIPQILKNFIEVHFFFGFSHLQTVNHYNIIIFKEDYRILIQGYLRHLKLTLVLYYNNKIL